MLRFQCDENVPNAIAEKLREAGIDALTAHEARLRRTPDEDILAQSTTEFRVVVTHDRDYLRMHRFGRRHAGIAYCQQGRRSIGEIIAKLIELNENMEPEDMSNQLVYL